MAEKNIKTRIIHKHDVDANWLLATNFTPKQGEIIVYDVDDNHAYERIKIGDGINKVVDLPFVDDVLRETLISLINDVDEKVDTVRDLVGDTKVSVQISDAISEFSADDLGVYVQDTEPSNATNGAIWVDTSSDPSFISTGLPVITNEDNGKVLMVVDGKWKAVRLSFEVDANGVVSI